MGVDVTADGAASSPGITTEWTRTTLGSQLVGELKLSARDSGETTPDRLARIVLASFGFCWSCHDWQFRERVGAVTIAASASEYAITTNHSDFAKTQVNALQELTGKGTLHLTTSRQEYEAAYIAELQSDGSTLNAGTPRVGYILPNTAISTYSQKLVFVPQTDAEHKYRLPYLGKAPSLGLTATPKWPDFMFRLWYLHAKVEAIKAFLKDQERFATAYRHFAGQLQKYIGQNDEEHTLSTSEMDQDPYGDLAALGMGACGYGALVRRPA